MEIIFLFTEHFEEKQKEDFLLISVMIDDYQRVFCRSYHVELMFDVDDRFVHPIVSIIKKYQHCLCQNFTLTKPRITSKRSLKARSVSPLKFNA